MTKLFLVVTKPFLSSDKTLFIRDKTILSRDKTLLSHDKTLLSHDKNLMSHDKTILSHDKTLFSRDKTVVKSGALWVRLPTRQTWRLSSGGVFTIHTYIHRLYLNSNYQSSSVELISSRTKKYINQLNY